MPKLPTSTHTVRTKCPTELKAQKSSRRPLALKRIKSEKPKLSTISCVVGFGAKRRLMCANESGS